MERLNAIEQGVAARRAARRRTMRVGKVDALFRQSVHVRRLRLGMTT